MSIVLALALALPPTTCSWDRPGVNPFMGDVVAAVDHYADIPLRLRAALKQRMAQHRYDDIVSIRRDSIAGKYGYAADLHDMHFGGGAVCAAVSRAKWRAGAEQRGLVYCEEGECIVVPTICRNVSRITRNGPANGAPAAPGTAPAPIPVPAPTPVPVYQSDLHSGSAPGTPPGSLDGTARGTAAESPLAAVPLAAMSFDTSASVSLGGGSAAPAAVLFVAPPIPEPQTWAMWLAGLAALALLARRRR